MFEELSRFVFIVIGRIEIRRLCCKFRRAGIYHLEDGMPLIRNGLPGHLFDHFIQERHFFRLQIELIRQGFCLKTSFHLDNIENLIQEPFVDHRNLVNPVHIRHTALQRLIDDENSLVVALIQSLGYSAVGQFRKCLPVQRIVRNFRTSYRFHQRLFKTLSDGHDFAGCLHLGAESTLRIDELVERPLWEFYHHIVDGRLEAGISVAGDGILDLIQRKSDGDLRSDLRNRIACRFRSQCGRSGNPGIYFDYRIFEAFRVESELTVAAAFYFQFRDNI